MFAFSVSLVFALLLVRGAKLQSLRFNDHDLSGPQKFHAVPVPRVGGIGVFVGVLAASSLLYWLDRNAGSTALLLALCALPAFVSGLTEDITKSQSPRRRLLFTAASALLAVLVLDAVITHTSVPGLDWIVAFPIGAAVVTIFAVAGVANSLNIIDGFNGLASMCAVLILTSIAYVAFQVGDSTIMLMALAGVGAVLGFFVWNYPRGLIFLGDGGAYFLGFYLAELAILLLHRNPQVSPMFPLLACVYPIFETLFSIYRRRFLRDVAPSTPDGIHLHSLIYRRVIRWTVDSSTTALTKRNSMTSPYLWLLCMLSVVPASLFWDNTPVLMACLVLFGLSYVALYWRIVRFKSPRWLKYHVERAGIAAQGDNQAT